MIMKQNRDAKNGRGILSVIYRGGPVDAMTVNEAEIALIGKVIQDVNLSENATMFVTEAFIMKVFHD